MCHVQNPSGDILDLSPLSDKMFSVASLVDDYQYELSVCGPMPANSDNRCPGATVCRTTSSASPDPIVSVSSCFI